MKLILAPMAGLTDFYMRDALTRIGQYDWCVSEFLRISDQLLPAKSFKAICPEITMGGNTAAGTPVHLQLLGSDTTLMAENAARAVEVGAPAIDLNFGCPAKLVNRRGGGAILLAEPEAVHAVVSAVRKAVPAHVPVSAKMRLGISDWSKMVENAQAIEGAGASWLTVHARTKENRYRPPAHWEAIAQIKQQVKFNIIANGEIWTLADAKRCQQLSGCSDLMLGRGAVRLPDLVNQLRGCQQRLNWQTLIRIQLQFLDEMVVTYKTENGQQRVVNHAWSERTALGRAKQWLAMLAVNYPEAAELFSCVKAIGDFNGVRAILKNQV